MLLETFELLQGKKIAVASICHSLIESQFCSSLVSQKIFQLARAGELKLPEFPDFQQTLDQLKESGNFNASMPQYTVCLGLPNGALVVRQSIIDLWTNKHEDYKSATLAVIARHDAEFSKESLKRGYDETGDDAAANQPAAKKLCVQEQTTVENLTNAHTSRTGVCVACLSTSFLILILFLGERWRSEIFLRAATC